MDVDNLLAGQRFEQQLQKALAECEVFIAVIGPGWLDDLKAKQSQRCAINRLCCSGSSISKCLIAS
jgi:hypothetical protein